jgi:hypothetical protein
MAMGEAEVTFTEWVKFSACSIDMSWTSRVVQAIVAHNLTSPVILGRPFLATNKVVIDHDERSVIAKKTGHFLLPGRTILGTSSPELVGLKECLSILAVQDQLQELSV